MRKPVFCICETKGALELHVNGKTAQQLSFSYIDSTIPLLPKFEIASLLLSSVVVQHDLCPTLSDIRRQDFS